MDGDGRGRKLASRYGQRAHRRPDIYRSSGRLACDGFWCFWCKHPRFCHNGNNGRHIVTNKRLQFSSLSCLGQPQWGGVRSGTYLATLHHLSRQFCMTFNLTLRVFRAWVGGGGREAGSSQTDTGRNATGIIDTATWMRDVSGVLYATKAGRAVSGTGIDDEYDCLNIDLARVWGEHAGTEFTPVHIRIPVLLYLGNSA